MFNEESYSLEELIDLSFEDFKKFLEGISIGNLTQLSRLFINSYRELVDRKDILLKLWDHYLSTKDANNSKETENTIKGIYCTLLRIEEKVVYMKELESKLKI